MKHGWVALWIGLLCPGISLAQDEATEPPGVAQLKKSKTETRTFRTLLGPKAKNAWAKKGFRLRVGYSSEYRFSHGIAPDHWVNGLTFEPTYQLDADWALGVQLTYGAAGIGTPQDQQAPFGGLVWNTFLNTQVRLVHHLKLSFGVGIAGILGSPATDREDQEAAFAAQTTALGSRMAEVGQKITSCYGYGPAANLNLTYIAPITPYFAAGPLLGVKSQHVQCSESGLTGSVNLETGRPIDMWQWWGHTSPYAGFYMVWR